ncbi:MAG: RES family NAD+ phosphorylase [Thermosphaera sp.]
MNQAWRITKRRWAERAFDGEGARRFGGRFNSKGTAVVYLGAHLSLAALEIIVNARRSELLEAYVFFRVSFDDELVLTLLLDDLPENWRESPAPESVRAIGNAWAKEQASLILEVPSAVIPYESNYLLNPLHPDMSRLVIEGPEPFVFDPRLAEV